MGDDALEDGDLDAVTSPLDDVSDEVFDPAPPPGRTPSPPHPKPPGPPRSRKTAQPLTNAPKARIASNAGQGILAAVSIRPRTCASAPTAKPPTSAPPATSSARTRAPRCSR